MRVVRWPLWPDRCRSFVAVVLVQTSLRCTSNLACFSRVFCCQSRLSWRCPRAGRRAPTPRSRVGQKLSNLTTSRVVVLVLGMLFITPAFNIGGGMYGSPPDLGLDGVKARVQP